MAPSLRPLRRSRRLATAREEAGVDGTRAEAKSSPAGRRAAAPDEVATSGMRAIETRLARKGHVVVGADEAGRGPLAGPVVAAACHLPLGLEIEGLNDSKAMSEEDRERVFAALTTNRDVRYAVSVVGRERIDLINILQAAMEGMAEAVRELAEGDLRADYALVDGPHLPKSLCVDGQSVVKGDARCACVAAASVLAKVTRDRLMVEMDRVYPQYGFAQHKGYGVRAHVAAIHEHGPSPEHRRTFAPVKHMLAAAAGEGGDGGEEGREPKAAARRQRRRPPGDGGPHGEAGRGRGPSKARGAAGAAARGDEPAARRVRRRRR